MTIAWKLYQKYHNIHNFFMFLTFFPKISLLHYYSYLHMQKDIPSSSNDANNFIYHFSPFIYFLQFCRCWWRIESVEKIRKKHKFLPRIIRNLRNRAEVKEFIAVFCAFLPFSFLFLQIRKSSFCKFHFLRIFQRS